MELYKSIEVVNCEAKRRVKLIQIYQNILGKDKTEDQNIAQTVKE